MSAYNGDRFGSLFCVKRLWLTLRRGGTAGPHCHGDLFLGGQAKLVTGSLVILHGEDVIECGTVAVEY